jgi:hypothetical protein
MSVIKNNYFTYSVGTDGVKHRDSLQVWNVTLTVGSAAKTVSIYVQGSLTGRGFSRDATFFAKKHLLTFAGGKAATANKGAAEDKMMRIAGKRQKDTLLKGLTGGQKKGKAPLPSGSLPTKYSTTPAKANTIISCDMLTPDALKKAFAEALLAGDGAEAHIELPGNAVLNIPEGATTPSPVSGATATDTVIVEIGYEKSSTGDSFAVIHLGGATKKS